MLYFYRLDRLSSIHMLLAVSNFAEILPDNSIYTVVCAIGLALFHLYASKLFLDVIPRSRWLSMASGVSVAYVSVHLLPDLNEEILAESEIFS